MKKYIVPVLCAASVITSLYAEHDLEKLKGEVRSFDVIVNNVGATSETAAFDTLIKNVDKVVVDFYADWCGPCKRLAPAVTQTARERKDILFVKLNVDRHKEVANMFSIRSIPTVHYFKDGKRISTSQGSMSRPQLKKKLQNTFK